jgi:N4-gp56 family major capsid protein
MALGNWTIDIADGVLKNHELSGELLRASYESTRAMEFAQEKPFGKHRGESLSVPRIHAITEPDFADLDELGDIPEDSYSITHRTITVGELARSLPYTSLQEDLLVFDLGNELQDLLKEQMRLVLDTKTILEYQTSAIKAVLNGAASVLFTTNGVPGAAATNDVSVAHVELIVKYLIETLFAPPVVDDDYFALLRYRSLLNIRQDSAWKEWHVYLSPESKYNGEAGRLERVRFIETNHKKALPDVAAGAGARGLFFGKDSVMFAEAVTPELRAGIPTQLGRKKLVGWYGLIGWKLKWETGNPREARVVDISST